MKTIVFMGVEITHAVGSTWDAHFDGRICYFDTLNEAKIFIRLVSK